MNFSPRFVITGKEIRPRKTLAGRNVGRRTANNFHDSIAQMGINQSGFDFNIPGHEQYYRSSNDNPGYHELEYDPQ